MKTRPAHNNNPNAIINSFKPQAIFKVAVLLFTIQFCIACSNMSEHSKLIVLEADCNSPGEIINGETGPNTLSGYPYRFSVYLPPCYTQDQTNPYPVIYLIPGRGGGTRDWFNANVNEIADQLILSREIPPFVIVGAGTTNDDPYADQIYNDLMPYVEENFNISEQRRYRAVGGGSLGGIASYRLVFKYADQFASAGMFGAGVIHGEDELVKTQLASFSEENRPRVFLNTGENDPLMLSQAKVMVTYLEEAGIPYEFIVDPNGDHTYAYWASNFETYFRWVAQDW